MDIYRNIKDYGPNKKQKILIVFDDMIADKLSNGIVNPIVTELFIEGRKLNISVVFITFYLAVQKNMRLNSTHYFLIKIPSKRELQTIAFNHLSDIDFQDFMNLYKKGSAKPYFLWLLILLLHQIILHISERTFYKEYKT